MGLSLQNHISNLIGQDHKYCTIYDLNPIEKFRKVNVKRCMEGGEYIWPRLYIIFIRQKKTKTKTAVSQNF